MNSIGDFTSAASRERYLAAYDRALDECPTPDAVFDVGTRHGTTRVYRFGGGDAPPIVLLPGLMATAAGCAPLIPGFAARRPVYAVDTLGEAGRSVQTAPLRDIPDRARCLDEVLERLELTGVHLVGGSTGGWHALNQAINAPGRIASISMLDPTTVTAPFSRTAVAFGLVSAIVNREWLWRRFLRWSVGEGALDRPEVRLVLAGIRAYRPRVPFQECPADDAIRSVRVPVLAIFGTHSVVHDSARAADRLRHLLPHAWVHVLPEAGHGRILRPDGLDRITGLVLDFVRHTAPERS